MKKLSLLILLLFSGAASAIPVSGFQLLKECGADASVCDSYAFELFRFDIHVDNTASDPSGLSDALYQVDLFFGAVAVLENQRQDAVITITETLPATGTWADVEWMPVCTAISDCFLSYDNSVPNQISFNLSTYADSNTLTIKAINSPVPVPAAVWLLGSGLLGLIGVARRKKAA